MKFPVGIVNLIFVAIPVLVIDNPFKKTSSSIRDHEQGYTSWTFDSTAQYLLDGLAGAMCWTICFISLLLKLKHRVALASNLICSIPIFLVYQFVPPVPFPSNFMPFIINILIRLILLIASFIMTHLNTPVIVNKVIQFGKVKFSLFLFFILFFDHGIFPVSSSLYFLIAVVAISPKLSSYFEQFISWVSSFGEAVRLPWREASEFGDEIGTTTTCIFTTRLICYIYFGCTICRESELSYVVSCVARVGIVGILDIFFLTRLTTIICYYIGRFVNLIVNWDLEMDADSTIVTRRCRGDANLWFSIFLCSGVTSLEESDAKFNSLMKSAMLIGSIILIHADYKVSSTLKPFIYFRGKEIRALVLGISLLIFSIITSGRILAIPELSISWISAFLVLTSAIWAPLILILPLSTFWNLSYAADSAGLNIELQVLAQITRFSIQIFFTFVTSYLKRFYNREQSPENYKSFDFFTIEGILYKIELYTTCVDILLLQFLLTTILYNIWYKIWSAPLVTILTIQTMIAIAAQIGFVSLIKLVELNAKRLSFERVNSFPDATKEELEKLSDDVCPICRAEMSCAAKMTNCAHVFHSECLRTLFKGATFFNPIIKCPMCQAPLISPEVKERETE